MSAHPSAPVAQSTAFVTGATSGFGAACAEAFARSGWKVILAGRRADRLSEMARRLGDDTLPIELDVRDRAAVEAAVAGLPEPFAAVDVLVNNAGLALGLEPAHRASLDQWQQMFGLDVEHCKRAYPRHGALRFSHVA